MSQLWRRFNSLHPPPTIHPLHHQPARKKTSKTTQGEEAYIAVHINTRKEDVPRMTQVPVVQAILDLDLLYPRPSFLGTPPSYSSLGRRLGPHIKIPCFPFLGFITQNTVCVVSRSIYIALIPPIFLVLSSPPDPPPFIQYPSNLNPRVDIPSCLSCPPLVIIHVAPFSPLWRPNPGAAKHAQPPPPLKLRPKLHPISHRFKKSST
ncbi:hypothetical protein JAAARDRAFT_542448 [Jaapia argillacea MUCL 33604]|uniref:Uncharacterized protein n=1 Tax=Jaapia argillacea MUCL 33604 TaxID=933084 RepID=A0A067P874_9AGAM|nr:hypothetical protein JAAARDRAFT_542448 [Jaapia argillacea MUCL 33604]